ncbi:MAG TPA: RNA methyltransferase [Puia sp.]|uniref:RNA methyltransferase n=1 Tax=Puia sp. TaxID=2045100 RepID=UPI002BBC632B|nr:RNA methyltransferase [Puia sp.]HVU96362.1 RNA methyltransferase [Puia sp.]
MTPEREQRITHVLDKRQGNLIIVLENVFDPHNISAVMRTCDAVGVQDIVVLNTRIPRHKKWGAKSSSSAANWLTIHQYDNTEECFAFLRTRADRIFATHLSSDAVSLYEMDLTRRVALIFGNEHSGVSEEILPLVDGNFIIPQVGIIRSLNISVACAVTLYEAYRQKQAAGQYDRPGLDPARRSELLKEWSRAGNATGAPAEGQSLDTSTEGA